MSLSSRQTRELQVFDSLRDQNVRNDKTMLSGYAYQVLGCLLERISLLHQCRSNRQPARLLQVSSEIIGNASNLHEWYARLRGNGEAPKQTSTTIAAQRMWSGFMMLSIDQLLTAETAHREEQ